MGANFRMSLRIVVSLVFLAFWAQAPEQANRTDADAQAKAAAALHARIEATPELPFHAVALAAKPRSPDWESGIVSWVAVDDKGAIYEIQRGDKADPVLVLDRQGNVLRSWGKGDYKIPHSIRVDRADNVWTVDAASSTVIKYSPRGTKLMTITVGGQPDNGSPFSGTTDIAFGPKGRLFITDGYGNARILEYSAKGRKVKEWGRRGARPGEFSLPHAIQIDEKGTIYVADRENGRIEKFDVDGNYVGEISHLGRVFAVKVTADALWATIQAHDQPVTSGGWIMKLDRKTGKIVGHLDVPEFGGHSIEVTRSGEPITTLGNELLWFKAS
jgi:sugar lactone lactonase YvrE